MAEVLLKNLSFPSGVTEEDIKRFADVWQPYDPSWSASSNCDYPKYFSENVVDEVTRRGGALYEIYESDESASVGFMLLAKDDACGLSVDILAIKAERQRQGFGRAAIFAAAQICKEEDIREITLQPLDSAIEFYEKLGFTDVPNPYGVTVMSARTNDLLLMRDVELN